MRITDKSLHPFFIDIDDNNFIVKEVSISNGEKTMGQEVENVVGYFSNLENCISRIIRLKVTREEKVVELQEFLGNYFSITSLIRETMDRYDQEART